MQPKYFSAFHLSNLLRMCISLKVFLHRQLIKSGKNKSLRNYFKCFKSDNKKKTTTTSLGKFSDHSFEMERFFVDDFSEFLFYGDFFRFSRNCFPPVIFYPGTFFPHTLYDVYM